MLQKELIHKGSRKSMINTLCFIFFNRVFLKYSLVSGFSFRGIFPLLGSFSHSFIFQCEKISQVAKNRVLLRTEQESPPLCTENNANFAVCWPCLVTQHVRPLLALILKPHSALICMLHFFWFCSGNCKLVALGQFPLPIIVRTFSPRHANTNV